jgi:glyoxylate reductase
MKPLVVSTSPLPGPWLAGLADAFDVRIVEPQEGRESFWAELPEAEALIALLTVPVGPELFARAPRLKIVANYAVGVDNVDRAAAAARGILVTHTPGVLTDATADATMALLLALFRRLIEGDRLVRAGGYAGWRPELLLGRDLKGKTLGIVGPGRIGKAVARRARAFGMVVVAFARSPRDPDDPDDPTRVSLDELWRRSDAVSLHVPLTAETRHLVDDAALAKMKPDAVLVNTARGPIVDEMALCRALAEGRIGGAGLDVFENEPLIAPALLDDDRVVLFPHAASATVETRSEMARMVCEDVRRVLSGEPPRWPAPAERGAS